jgi:hypothetical protein
MQRAMTTSRSRLVVGALLVVLTVVAPGVVPPARDDRAGAAPAATRTGPAGTLPPGLADREMVTHTAPAALGPLPADGSDRLELQRALPGTDPDPPRQQAAAHGVEPFVLIGFSWTGADGEPARVRVHTAEGWTAWRPVVRDGGHGPTTTSDPLWVGHADGWELGVGDGAAELVVHLVRPAERPATGPLDPPDADPLTGGAADLGPHTFAGERPPVSDRSRWGARPPRIPTWTGHDLRLVVLHHTATGDGNAYGPGDVPAMLRAVQAFHMDANGWLDIGYNFVVDRFGRIWEGRDHSGDGLVVGAHAAGVNDGTVGIAVLGDFSAVPAAPAAVDAVTNLAAWLLFRHGADPRRSGTVVPRASGFFTAGAPVELPRIVGHQDVTVTGCPGDLERILPWIREAAVARYLAMQGPGTFRRRDLPPAPPGVPVVADLNGDGADDVLWYAAGGVTDTVWTSDRRGGVVPASIDIDSDAGTLTVLDWDGDGTDDVLASDARRGGAVLVRGHRTGPPTVQPLDAPAAAVPYPADINGDGDDDIVWWSPSSGVATLWVFGDAGVERRDLGPVGHRYRPAVGDFNGDQRDDVLWFDPLGPDSIWWGRTDLLWHQPAEPGRVPALWMAD